MLKYTTSGSYLENSLAPLLSPHLADGSTTKNQVARSNMWLNDRRPD